MPANILTNSTSVLPDLRTKSPRRFFTFAPSFSSAPLPPLPPLPAVDVPPVPPLPSGIKRVSSVPLSGHANYVSNDPYATVPTYGNGPIRRAHTPTSSTSSSASFGLGLGLGSGATVVRTPSEARRGMTKSPRVIPSSSQSRTSSSSASSGAVITPSISRSSSARDEFRPTNGKEASLRPRSAKLPTIGQSYSTPFRKASRDSLGGGRSHLECGNDVPELPALDLHASRISLGFRTPSPTPYPSLGLANSSSFSVSTPMSYSSTSTATPSPSPQTPMSPPRRKSLSAKSSLPNLAWGQQREKLGAERDREWNRATLKPPPKSALPPTPVLSQRTSEDSPPVPIAPFGATLLSCSTRQAAPGEDITLITIHFAYSLEDKPDTSCVTLPLSALLSTGGQLIRFVEDQLARLNSEAPTVQERRMSAASDYTDRNALAEGMEGHEELRPEMTDGESAEESDVDSEYGLTTLLRDEYLRSLWVTSPATPSFLDHPAPMPITDRYPTPPKHKARTRNQYVQLGIGAPPVPAPPVTAIPAALGVAGIHDGNGIEKACTSGDDLSVSLAGNGTKPLNIQRPRALSLKSLPRDRNQPRPQLQSPFQQRPALPTAAPARLVEMHILLSRDAAPYHLIAARLLGGLWPKMEAVRRKRVEDELRWAGMEGLIKELAGRGGKEGRRSGVTRGGQGYI